MIFITWGWLPVGYTLKTFFLKADHVTNSCQISFIYMKFKDGGFYLKKLLGGAVEPVCQAQVHHPYQTSAAKKKKLELLPCGCMFLWISHVWVIIHVCPDSCSHGSRQSFKYRCCCKSAMNYKTWMLHTYLCVWPSSTEDPYSQHSFKADTQDQSQFYRKLTR